MTQAGTKDHPITIEPIAERVRVVWRGRTIGDSARRARARRSGLQAGRLYPARRRRHEPARAHRPRHDLPLQGRGELLFDRGRRGARRQRGLDLRDAEAGRRRNRAPSSPSIRTGSRSCADERQGQDHPRHRLDRRRRPLRRRAARGGGRERDRAWARSGAGRSARRTDRESGGKARFFAPTSPRLPRCARSPKLFGARPTASTSSSTTPGSARRRATARGQRRRLRAALRGQLSRGLPADASASAAHRGSRGRRASSMSPRPGSSRSTFPT